MLSCPPIRRLLLKTTRKLTLWVDSRSNLGCGSLFFFKPRIGGTDENVEVDPCGDCCVPGVCGSWLSEDANCYGDVASIGSRNRDNPAHAARLTCGQYLVEGPAAVPLLPFRL